MALFGNNASNSLLKNAKSLDINVVTTEEMYTGLLRILSGASEGRATLFDIFYKIYAFVGIKEGIGCSTFVANLAYALAQLGLKVLIIDTSILAPVQDVLLKTNYKEKVDKEKQVTWFDLPYTKMPVLHETPVHANISILSLYGNTEGILDLVSVNDNNELVRLALETFENNFDFILMDCNHEPSSINVATLQQAQRIIQVWDDSPLTLQQIDSFINDCATLAIPLDKMRYVVMNQQFVDIPHDVQNLYKQYNLTQIASNNYSKEVRSILQQGKMLFQYPSTDADVVRYTESLLDTIKFMCNVKDETTEVKVDTKTKKEKGKLKDKKAKDVQIDTTTTNDSNIIAEVSNAESSVQSEMKPVNADTMDSKKSFGSSAFDPD